MHFLGHHYEQLCSWLFNISILRTISLLWIIINKYLVNFVFKQIRSIKSTGIFNCSSFSNIFGFASLAAHTIFLKGWGKIFNLTSLALPPYQPRIPSVISISTSTNHMLCLVCVSSHSHYTKKSFWAWTTKLSKWTLTLMSSHFRANNLQT